MSLDFSDTEWVSAPAAGTTLAAVAATITAMPEAATTKSFPRYAYETTGDVISSVTVTVRTRVTMPDWSGYATASQAEKDEWDRFCAALRAHEQGHIQLVLDNLAGIDGQLVGKSVSDAAQAWNDALVGLKSASDAYDQSTDHGRNQGTTIDISVSPSEGGS
jgi:predicted secreted Zn-dependent protease